MHRSETYLNLVLLLTVALSIPVLCMLAGVLWVVPRLPPAPQLLYIAQPDLANRSRLYVHDLHTGLRHALRDDLLGWGLDAAWSPDGERIAYTSFQFDAVRRDIFIYDPASGERQAITTGDGDYNSPAWSPDGRYLAYQGLNLGETWDIYLHDLETGEHRIIYKTFATDGRPAWRPDGRTLALETVYAVSRFPDIVLLDMETMQTESITAPASTDIAADWSPDGEQIAYASDTYGTFDIFVMDVAKRDVENPRLLLTSPANELDPAWSPDGQQIAYGTRRAADQYRLHIYIMNADGSGEPRRITDGDEGYVQPDWRP